MNMIHIVILRGSYLVDRCVYFNVLLLLIVNDSPSSP
jgi:hypothetical protein